MDLAVAQGELFGFLGPNGAGKTTTIRILTTLLRPTQGRAWVAGFDVQNDPLEATRRVGFMPENPGFYATLTGRQHLRYYAGLYGKDRSQLDGRIDSLLERVGLAESGGTKVKAYSLGMKRRLALAGAILPDPDILILDEPSLGLDPAGMAFVRTLLTTSHEEGTTIFLSSHILSEVEKICTHVGVLHQGRLLKVDTPRALVQALGPTSASIEVATRGVQRRDADKIEAIDRVERVDIDGNVLRVYGSLDDDVVVEVNRLLVQGGVGIVSSRRLEADLEEAFLTLTGDQA
jgi:ABC-2 type transport system ATP-binding protein